MTLVKAGVHALMEPEREADAAVPEMLLDIERNGISAVRR